MGLVSPRHAQLTLNQLLRRLLPSTCSLPSYPQLHSVHCAPFISSCASHTSPHVQSLKAPNGSSSTLHTQNKTTAQPRSYLLCRRSYNVEGATAQTALIRQLRERSSAPIKDVKTALVQSQWDVDAAFKELRKKGLAAASKKASRVAAEGLLAVSEENGSAAIVEINSETDFVARNEIFQYLALCVAKAALSVEASPSASSQAAVIDPHALEVVRIVLEHPKLNGEATVREAIVEAAAMLGENLQLRRGFHLHAHAGVVSSYLHMSHQPGLARTAGLLTLEVEEGTLLLPSEPLNQLGESLAMHVVAARPLFLSKDLVTPEVLDHEKEIIWSQAAASNKPEAVIQKMVEGRLRKYMEEVVLLDQKFVMNDKMSVGMVLDDLSKELGTRVNVGCFLRLEVGEGIEREEKSFAAEVAAQAG